MWKLVVWNDFYSSTDLADWLAESQISDRLVAAPQG